MVPGARGYFTSLIVMPYLINLYQATGAYSLERYDEHGGQQNSSTSIYSYNDY